MSSDSAGFQARRCVQQCVSISSHGPSHKSSRSRHVRTVLKSAKIISFLEGSYACDFFADIIRHISLGLVVVELANPFPDSFVRADSARPRMGFTIPVEENHESLDLWVEQQTLCRYTSVRTESDAFSTSVSIGE